MIIELKRPFASNGEVDGGDVLRLKRALNRLGYYVPDKKTGITPVPDRAVFSGLEAFQKDHGLAVTGTAKPGDETVERLNAAIEKRGEQGRYIWQTVGDDKVRESHADLEGQERSWRDFPRPGEEHNCRCWAVPVPDTPCDQERNNHAEVQKRVKDLSDKLNDLLLRLDGLREENNTLVENAQKSLGGEAVAYVLTLPFDRLGVLSELLRRYFGNIINDKFLQAADNFMRQRQVISQKVQYARDQRDLVFFQLEQAAKELEEIEERLEECEEAKEER